MRFTRNDKPDPATPKTSSFCVVILWAVRLAGSLPDWLDRYWADWATGQGREKCSGVHVVLLVNVVLVVDVLC